MPSAPSPYSSAISLTSSIKRAVAARRLLSVLLHLTARLPLWLVHGLGAVFGWMLWLIPNPQSRVAATNLELCFPEWDGARRRILLKRNLMETGKAMLELGPLWLWHGQRVLGLIRSVDGEEAIQAAVARGRGGIAITPHLGAWEVSGLYVSSRYPLTLLYRPSRLGLDAIIRTGRERLGARAVPTDRRGVRALYDALRAGRVLGILPDQDPGRDGGVFAPFFGHSANTMVLLSRLAMKSQAPVFLVYSERLPWGGGYRLRFRLLAETVNGDSLAQSLATVNRAVEDAIRALPDQYLWVYKRFKRRPAGEPKLY